MRDKEWLVKEVDRLRLENTLSNNPMMISNRDVIAKVSRLIDQLDEPKITEEQAWNKIAESYPTDARSLAVAFEHFYYEGFTKKEPRWVVKTDTGYLNYLEVTPSKAFTVETSTEKEDAIFFYEELRANHFATLVDGIFEEVTE